MHTENTQVLEAIYQQGKLNLGNGYLLWFFGLHYAHLGKWGRQIIFRLSFLIFVGFVRWLLQGLEVRRNIEKHNQNLRTKLGLQN